MGLCFDFGTVLEGHPDVVLAVNGDVVHHRQPVGFPELRQRLPAPQLIQVGFDLVPAECALDNQVGNLDMSGFGLIEPRHKAVIAFLVFGLIQGDMCVLSDAFLNELGCDIDFRFKFGGFGFKVRGVEAFGKDLLVYGYKLFLLVNDCVSLIRQRSRFGSAVCCYSIVIRSFETLFIISRTPREKPY